MALRLSKDQCRLSVVGLFFAVVGLAFVGWLVWTLWRVADARSWIETPATIREARLVYRKKGSASVRVRYDYAFAGRRYEGSEVSIYSGSDNLGSFQTDAAAELSKYVVPAVPAPARTDPRPAEVRRFRCFVNPRHPEEAVLYRTLRPQVVLFQLLFAVVFGGVGLAVLRACWSGGEIVEARAD